MLISDAVPPVLCIRLSQIRLWIYFLTSTHNTVTGRPEGTLSSLAHPHFESFYTFVYFSFARLSP